MAKKRKNTKPRLNGEFLEDRQLMTVNFGFESGVYAPECRTVIPNNSGGEFTRIVTRSETVDTGAGPWQVNKGGGKFSEQGAKGKGRANVRQNTQVICTIPKSALAVNSVISWEWAYAVGKNSPGDDVIRFSIKADGSNVRLDQLGLNRERAGGHSRNWTSDSFGITPAIYNTVQNELQFVAFTSKANPGTAYKLVTALDNVRVTDDDTGGPDIRITPPRAGATDAEDNQFRVAVSDPSGVGRVTAKLTRDGIPIVNGGIPPNWTSPSLKEPGNYELVVTAVDLDQDCPGDASTSTGSARATIVDDDVTGPTISLLGPSPGATDATDNRFTWNVTDPSSLAEVFIRVKLDGEPIAEGLVRADHSFELNGVGTFMIDMQATDGDRDRPGDGSVSNASLAVTITDDDSQPPSISVEQPGGSLDSGDNKVRVSVSDPSGADLLPVVLKDGKPIYDDTSPVTFPGPSGSWEFDLNEYGVGEYTVSVTGTDRDADGWLGDGTAIENPIVSTFEITDDDAVGPTIDARFGTQSLDEGSVVGIWQSNKILKWNITDSSGVAEASIKVWTKDDSRRSPVEPVFESTDPSGEVDLGQFGINQFEIYIDALDGDSDWVGDAASDLISYSFVEIVAPTSPCCFVRNENLQNFDELNKIEIDAPGLANAFTQLGDTPVLILSNSSTGERFEVSNRLIDYDLEYGRASWDLSGLELSKGAYSAILESDQIRDEYGFEMDGDRDGEPGGSFVNSFQLTWRGDTDLDVDVDFADFLQFAENFGRTSGAQWDDGDFDGDRDVDFDDFLNLSAQFSNSAKPADAAAVDAAMALLA